MGRNSTCNAPANSSTGLCPCLNAYVLGTTGLGSSNNWRLACVLSSIIIIFFFVTGPLLKSATQKYFYTLPSRKYADLTGLTGAASSAAFGRYEKVF